jgi:hypothetical protein
MVSLNQKSDQFPKSEEPYHDCPDSQYLDPSLNGYDDECYWDGEEV